MTSSSYKGVKLDSANYYEWQNSALAYISARGVYEYIEHPDGLRPRVGSPSADVIKAAKDAAERAGGLETFLTTPAPPPAGQPAGAPQTSAVTTTRTWFVSLPDPVSRRVESVTLAPKSVSLADYRDWVKQARIAVGIIWDTLGPTVQKNDNIAYLMRSGDPLLLWAAIFRRVNPTTASARYAAMNGLMSVKWQDGWGLEDGHAAVMERFHSYLDHRSPGMTADEILNEVALFAYLSIVPPELDTFSSTLFINAGDQALTLAELLGVLQQEDSTQELRGNPRQGDYRARIARELAARAQAIVRPAGSVGAATPGSIKMTPRDALAALQASRPTWSKCWLCYGDHSLESCGLISRAQRFAKELRESKNDNRRTQQTANAAAQLAPTESAGDEQFPEAPNAAHLT